MDRPTIYVTQVPHRRDPQTQSLVPAIDLTAANSLGHVIVLMPPNAVFLDTLPLMSQMKMKLHNYNRANGDCLLTLGDPIINAAAIAILTKKGPFCVLRWDKNRREYAAVHITP